MSSRRFLKRLSQFVHRSGASKKSRNFRASKVRRAVFEQLENRRLFVADLVSFLTTEHVDINLQRAGSEWLLGPRNSDENPPIQYANDEAVLYVGEPAIESRPSGIEYDFTGVAAGSSLYILPAAQNQDLLYQGFAAYGLAGLDIDPYNAVPESKGRVVSTLASRWAKATLTDVRHTTPDGTIGNGHFSLWQTSPFGDPSVLMASYNDGVSNANANGLDVTDGVTSDDALWIQRGAHLHYNFGFTQPGRYEVDFKLSAYFGDDGLSTPNLAGFSQSDDITLYFSVMSVGQLQFDASSYSVNEGAGTASINVVRVGGSDGRIMVNYTSSNGTATAGSDYTSASGTLEFLDGEITKSITIPILEDMVDEADETLHLTLNAAGPQSINDYLIDIEGDANGLLGSVATAVLTVLDNDEPVNTPPTVSDVPDQVTDEDTATGAIAFVVGDAQTAAGSLSVSATSSNADLVPNANIVFGGSGANRTVTITPALNQFGTTTITLTVTDAGGLTATDTFLLTVNSINDLPTISDVGNQSTDEDTAIGAIPFTVGDVETAAGALAVTATSSDQNLIPNANIVIGGSGANRTVTITPAANLSGSVTITLTVTDAGGLTATDNFVLTVGGVNDAPTISNVDDQSTNEDIPTGAIAFTVGDLETPAGSLVVTATSSNSSLVPIANIAFAGSGANRTATVTPALNQFGSTTITLTVTDAGGLTATDTFVLNVSAVNDLPTISDIGNQTTPAGTSVGPINFTIGDVETAAGSLAVSAASSNTTLLPLAGIVIAGSGANRTVTLSPAVGLTGTATVTLTVTDADGASSSDTFDLVVTSNSLPTISDIANRFVLEGNSTGPIAFTVGDAETAANDLTVTATSSNPAVIPNGNIVLGGSGTNRSITINSVPNQVGPTTITVTVTDAGGLQTSDAFVLTIVANRLVPFAMPTFYGSTLSASRSVTGDFNGDGHADKITASASINTLAYFEGTGTGGFGAERRLNSGLNLFSLGITAVDYDRDNDLDLIAVESSESTFDTFGKGMITLYQNDGAGQFTRVVLKSGLMAGQHVASGDFNGDGRPDLAWSSTSTDPTTFVTTASYDYALQMTGGELGTITTLASNDIFVTLISEDIDGDSRTDLVAVERTNNPSTTYSLQVRRGNGDGTFSAPLVVTSGSGVTRLWQIVDLNGDGRRDLLVTDSIGDSRLGYYPQQANGSFGSRVGLLQGIGRSLGATYVADVNKDGVLDIATQFLGGAFGSGLVPSIYWVPGIGGGAYGTPIMIAAHNVTVSSVEVLDLDGDAYPDILASGNSSPAVPGAVVAYINKSDENPMVLIPPTPSTRIANDPIDVQVYFGVPITVTGTPRIALNLAGNTVYANYVSGSGTPTLRFRYIVSATDVDFDGVQLNSNLIELNGGTLTDPIGGAGRLDFPNVVFNGVIVNARGPLVQMITRLDPNPTSAATARFAVQFNEAVTNVDVSDFSVRMIEGNLTGASVQSVTGSGISYQVTVSTGSGSGALGLSVGDSASILDLVGRSLAKGYAGGEVYTVRQQPVVDVNQYYTDGHADYRPLYNNGEFSFELHGSEELPSDEVITYLDNTAIVSRPADATYDFIGVGANQPLYLADANGSVVSVPFIGWSGESVPVNVFAEYLPSDPRITSTTPREFLKVQMVAVRSSSGGHFSMYQTVIGNPPKVWMATSNGITSDDNFWLNPGQHIHLNTAFSKSGVYEVDVAISGFLDSNANNAYDPFVDTFVESGIKTMVFHVDALGARNDVFEVSGKDMLRGSVTLNDDWNDGLGTYTASVQTTTAKGTLSLQPNGSFTYQPSATFDGSDSFTYRLTNPRGGFTTAAVTITGSVRPDFEEVLKTGHADIGVNFADDVWDLHIHQHEPDTEYEPDEALFYVGRDAMLTRTGDSANAAYDFLGVPVGSTLFVLPEVENTNLLFLGIGGEELGEGLLDGDVATLRLASVSGPGQFSMWQAGLTATTPKLLMATSDGIDASDAFDVGAGSHAHANFAFTTQGLYEVTFVASGVDADGNATDSGQVTYHFYVTDGLVPFAMPNFLDPNITGATAPQLSDLNGDGKLDLAITRGASGVGYVLGIGDGSFLPVQLLAGSTGARNDLVAIDFDGDGDVDLLNSQANATDTADILSLYLNDGTANFTRVELITSLPRSSSQIEAADLNGDGRPDVVYGKGNTVVAYALQQPDGTLGSEVILPVTLTIASVQVTDLDADGDQDIVVGNRTGANNGAITVFKNSGSGVFTAAQTISTGNFPSVLKLTDMDGDGRVDIVTTQLIANTRVGWYPQMPNGTFGARVNVMTSVQQLNSLEVGDFNVDGVPDIVAGVTQLLNGTLSFVSVWSAGLGSGAFANPILLDPNQGNNSGMRVADLDGDSYPDIIATGNADSTRPSAVRVLINKTGEDPMVLVPPASRSHVVGDVIELSVYFGFPVTVTGTPRIALQLGANTVYANYLSGSATGTLKFRYAITTSDVDFDGVQLASNVINLNGGTITDPLGGNAVLTFPNLTFDGVIVNGAGPLVQGISRLDARATEAATVRFQIQFGEAVTGVDIGDFAVVMNAGDLAGASVVSVTGSSSLYEVTVSTGTGSGTLGLSVKGTANIFDLNGDILGKGFTGGEVYTVRREAIGDIDTFYTNAHADYRMTLNNGEFSWILRPDAGLLPNSSYPSEEVYTYLDSTAIVTRPTTANYDFLGVPSGAPLYLSNSSGNIASVPFLGFSGESILPGVFANYVPADPRITSTTPQGYMKVEMVGMRSSTGGDFSIYSIASGNPRVWMASSDGISSTDNIWSRWGSHTHYNTAFSKSGIYEVDVVISGFIDSNGNGTYDPIIDQYIESGIKTMVFNIDTLGARDDAFKVNSEEILRGSVTLNDDWDNGIGAYTASVQSTTTKGALALQPNGSFTYQPSATFDGSDSFTYRLTNPRGGFTSATVTITGSTRPDFDAVLRTGHADIGVNFEDDAWDLHIHDEETDTEYEPDEAMFYVGRDAMLTRTGDAANTAYDFLGAPVGSTLFVLPQVENPNLLFLGIGGEELADGLLEGDKATLRLASVSGPGQFSIWQSGLTPTTPKLLVATSDGIDTSDAFDVGAGSHAHANFAFTKQGFYEVTFVATGIDASGNATDSGQVTYHFYVSDGLVPFAMPSYQGPSVGPSGFQSQMADFNGDGELDLIVAGSGGNALGYRQGIGDGSFMPEQLLNAGSGLSAQGIVAVDYDGDGDMDLVAQEYVQSVANTGTITLYRNNGTASFTRVVLASGHPESYRVVAGDLNGDGRTDLVYDKALSTVAYALQQPNGELAAETALPVTFGSAEGVFLGDVDNDNDLDIVVSNRANGVNAYFSVFSNNGSGVFSAPQNTTTGIFPVARQLVDMNGDGRLDVVTGESVAGSRAGYYPQLSDGTFGARVVVLPTNTQLNSIRVADINGDGIPDIAAGAIVGGVFSMVWSPGLGGGAFGNTILIDPNQGNAFSLHVADLDGDSNPDIVTTGTRSETLPSAVRVYINKTGENPMVLIPPAARTRVAGDPIDLDVYFGFPITVTGVPRIALQVGSETRYATYLSGSGTPTLKFRYLVTNTDVDLDGVQLTSNVIQLNGGTLTDPLGGAAVLEFPNAVFSGVVANGVGPLVTGIARLDARSTEAASVRFRVQFNEDVTDVDVSDFEVVMNAGDLSGATIQSVTGAGNLYEVTVTTGTGTGTLGLSVPGTASILDLSGVVLARAFVGGEVYTVRKAALGELDIYYTNGHADYRPVFNNGEFSYVMHGDAGVLPEIEHSSDEVYTYADSNAIVNRSTNANYNFTGVGPGAPLYVLPSTQNVSLPYLGLSGDSLVAGTFAAYRPTEDPRITSATIREYVKVQMVGMRSSSGGEFSLFSGTTPTVWMASSDGISENDSFWLYRTHFHRNLAFSKPGIYEVDVVISGYLDSNGNGIKDATDVYVESGIKTMVFNIDTLGAVEDAFSVNGQDMLRGSVTLNDDWNDGIGAYTASVQATTSKGTLVFQPNGSFTYQPSATFDGSDTFTYRLTNPRGGFTTGTATITGSTRPDFGAILQTGHADIGVNFADNIWDLHIHQHEPDTEYEPDEAVLYVGSEAMITRSGDTANAAYDFLGVPAGSSVFVLPEVENTNLLFLGIGGEELGQGLLGGDVAKLRLASVSGPGHFSIWQAGLTATTPKLIMATSDGIDASDAFDVVAGSHSHANFAFSRKGYYEVTFVASGVDAAGNETDSGMVTYYFEVGNDPVMLTRVNSTVTGEVQATLANTGTWADPESNNASVELTASIGTVVKNVDGTWSWSHTPTTYMNNVPVTITANDGVNSSEVAFNVTANTFAAGRSVFYNNATGDNLGSEGAANNAIDSSKSVLRTPGATSTFANYTNYSRGLNGLIVDIAGLPATVTDAQMLASLQFAHWNAISAGGFAALPVAAVPTVTILSNNGVGGSARVKITFPDNTVQNTWLRVTVLANTTTGLAANDVFYFGNVIGDVNVGNTATRLRVNATDTGAVRSNQSTAANSASVTNIFDVNRDGRVNATDTGIVRSNQQTAGIVAPLTIPAGAPPAGLRPAGAPTSDSKNGVSPKGGSEVGEGAGKEAGSFSYSISSSTWLEALKSDPIDSKRVLESTVRPQGMFDHVSLPVVGARVLPVGDLVEEKRDHDAASQKKSSKSRESRWHDAFFASLVESELN